LRFDPALASEDDARALLGNLEDYVASGQCINSGGYLRFGWMGLHLHEIGRDLLAVAEPDMRGFPVEFVDSVTTTLRHLRWQKDCAARLGLVGPLSFPSMFQKAEVCSHLACGDGFFMERKTGTEKDSGWFIGCADARHEHEDCDRRNRLSLYELVLSFNEALATFLALPAGTKILNTAEGVWISCGGNAVPIQSGAYLELLMSRFRPSRSATVKIDDRHNLLELSSRTETATYSIPAAQRLVLECADGYGIPVTKELRAIGIEKTNTVLLLTKNGQYRRAWLGAASVEFDLHEAGRIDNNSLPRSSALKEGDEIIVIIGYVDPAPSPVTKGGIAGMWSARLRVGARAG